MAGLGSSGLLDVPLHPDEEERLVLCKLNVEFICQDFALLSRSTGSHSATEDKRARTPMVSSYGVIPVGGCRIVVLSVVVVVKEPAVKLSCVMSEGKGSHTSSSNEGKGRMLRLRHSSSNSLRVGLTKLNLLVGWRWVVCQLFFVC